MTSSVGVATRLADKEPRSFWCDVIEEAEESAEEEAAGVSNKISGEQEP